MLQSLIFFTNVGCAASPHPQPLPAGEGSSVSFVDNRRHPLRLTCVNAVARWGGVPVAFSGNRLHPILSPLNCLTYLRSAKMIDERRRFVLLPSGEETEVGRAGVPKRTEPAAPNHDRSTYVTGLQSRRPTTYRVRHSLNPSFLRHANACGARRREPKSHHLSGVSYQLAPRLGPRRSLPRTPIRGGDDVAYLSVGSGTAGRVGFCP